MNNWWKILHIGERQGWLTYNDLASCVPEGTSTVETIDAINICKALGIQLLSNVEGLPVAENIQEMCEFQDRIDMAEFIAAVDEEDTAITGGGKPVPHNMDARQTS